MTGPDPRPAAGPHAAAEAAGQTAPGLSDLEARALAEHGQVVSPLAGLDERAIEGALRPKRLDEIIGQHRVRDQLSLIIEGALGRGRAPDHVLMSGPPGLGKTTFAMIIAAELGAPLRITSGPAIERAGDLAAILSTLGERDVVFIGQHRVRDQLSLIIEGALGRGRAPDHVLMSGPPGLGKTTFAMIIAAELGAPLRITSGPAIERAGDLAAILSTLGERDVVFID